MRKKKVSKSMDMYSIGMQCTHDRRVCILFLVPTPARGHAHVDILGAGGEPLTLGLGFAAPFVVHVSRVERVKVSR